MIDFRERPAPSRQISHHGVDVDPSLTGFQAYLTFGHTRARYFPPELGGLIFQGTASVPGVFRIDYDQAYQQTVKLRYERGEDGLYAAFIWCYDSGPVVTGVPDVAATLTLTPSQ